MPEIRKSYKQMFLLLLISFLDFCVKKVVFCTFPPILRQIVDNFFHLFVGHACGEGKKCVFLWITASYPHISTKLSTTGENGSGKKRLFVPLFRRSVRKIHVLSDGRKERSPIFLPENVDNSGFWAAEGQKWGKVRKSYPQFHGAESGGVCRKKKEKKRIVFFTKRWYNNKKEKNLPRQSARQKEYEYG